MSTPSSLAEAMTAQKLTRTAALAWRSAFHGRSMPSALADAIETLTHVGDRVAAAAIAAQVRQVALASGSTRDKAQETRNDTQTDVDGSNNEAGRSVARSGQESNREKQP